MQPVRRFLAVLTVVLGLGVSAVRAECPLPPPLPPTPPPPPPKVVRIDLGTVTAHGILNDLIKSVAPNVKTAIARGNKLVLWGPGDEVDDAEIWVRGNLIHLHDIDDEQIGYLRPLKHLSFMAAQNVLNAAVTGLSITDVSGRRHPSLNGVIPRPQSEAGFLGFTFEPGASRIENGRFGPRGNGNDPYGSPGLGEAGKENGGAGGGAAGGGKAPGSDENMGGAPGGGGTPDPQKPAGAAVPRPVQRVEGELPRGIGGAVLLVGTRQLVERGLELLDRIDRPKAQVLIEARILEVNPEKRLAAGVDWNGLDEILGATVLRESEPTSVFRFGRFARTGFRLDAIVRALEVDRRARLLASPTVTVVDGEWAEMFIGDKITFTAVKDLDTNGRTTAILAQQDIGIQLVVHPVVNVGAPAPADEPAAEGAPASGPGKTDALGQENSVTMRLIPSVGSAIGFTRNPAGDQIIPQVRLRRAETTVRLDDGEFFAIGGLISDEEIRQEERIPFLGRLPLIGHLFKTTRKDRRRTDLVILLSPRIIDQGEIPQPIFQDEKQPARPLFPPQLPPASPALSLRLERDTAQPGSTVEALLTLPSVAPTGGADVQLEALPAGEWAPLIPRSVHIPEGQQSARFTVAVPSRTRPGSRPRTLEIRASRSGETATARLRVR